MMNASKLFARRARPAPPAAALYERIVDAARDPQWYVAGAVPDSVDGRFDALALVLSLVLNRFQRDGAGQAEADLADRFTADLDANLREMGVGDLSISKHVGRGVGALGGRVGAYGAALDGGDLAGALTRNLYRGASAAPGALGWAVRHTLALDARIAAIPLDALIAGEAAL